VITKDFCKSMGKNIELIEGVREIIVFTAGGSVYFHNVKSFAVKKAVLIFLFHHLMVLASNAASQLGPLRFLAESKGSKLLAGRLDGEIYVAVTGDPGLDHMRIFGYLDECRQMQHNEA